MVANQLTFKREIILDYLVGEVEEGGRKGSIRELAV